MVIKWIQHIRHLNIKYTNTLRKDNTKLVGLYFMTVLANWCASALKYSLRSKHFILTIKTFPYDDTNILFVSFQFYRMGALVKCSICALLSIVYFILLFNGLNNNEFAPNLRLLHLIMRPRNWMWKIYRAPSWRP